MQITNKPNMTDNIFDCIVAKGKKELDEVATVKSILDAFDRDRDQALDNNEFASLMRQLFCDETGCPYAVDSIVQADIFGAFDINRDGKIDAKEFQRCWREWIKEILFPVNALIIVDVQNDFISGSLAVCNCPAGHDGNEVVPIINLMLDTAEFDVVVYSMDWHPANHVSFVENVNQRKIHSSSKILAKDARVFDIVVFEEPAVCEQKLWPAHCIQESWGAKLHPDLRVADNAVFVYKGTNPDIDSYSAFWDNAKKSKTVMHSELSRRNITDVYVCGLAYEICVASTARHALEHGYRTIFVEDACRGLCNDDIQKTRSKLLREGAAVVDNTKVKAMIEVRDRRLELGHKAALNLSKGIVKE